MNLDALIKSLQKLYTEMASRALKIRRGLAGHWKSRHHGGSIASPLDRYIEKIASQSGSGAPAANHTGDDAPSATEFGPGRAGSAGALKNYLDSRKAATVVAPELGNRLKQSVWRHLHEAIRYGRLGDLKNAKMHSVLADEALKEAVQFMSRDDFAALLDEIQTKFEEVLKETQD
jgi:hypothetical protein